MAVETLPVTPREDKSLVLTPPEAETIKEEFRGTAHYIYASKPTQEEFDDLSTEELGAWVSAWPGGQNDLSESLSLMRARLLEESSSTPR